MTINPNGDRFRTLSGAESAEGSLGAPSSGSALNEKALEAAADALAIDWNAEITPLQDATTAITAYLSALTVTTGATVEHFINERPGYIAALKGTRGTDEQSDYWRWSGHAEARRQLATTLGMTVPHEPGETTAPVGGDS